MRAVPAKRGNLKTGKEHQKYYKIVKLSIYAGSQFLLKRYQNLETRSSAEGFKEGKIAKKIIVR